MSYNCAPNIGLLGLYSSGQRAAPLRSWKSFVVCGKVSLDSFFAHSAAFFWICESQLSPSLQKSKLIEMLCVEMFLHEANKGRC